jgi:hypothetical protein
LYTISHKLPAPFGYLKEAIQSSNPESGRIRSRKPPVRRARTGLSACIFFASGKKGYRFYPLRVVLRRRPPRKSAFRLYGPFAKAGTLPYLLPSQANQCLLRVRTMGRPKCGEAHKSLMRFGRHFLL